MMIISLNIIKRGRLVAITKQLENHYYIIFGAGRTGKQMLIALFTCELDWLGNMLKNFPSLVLYIIS